MGLCGSTEAINPDFVDLSHFELLKVVGKGGFGKGERQLDGAGAIDNQRARGSDCPNSADWTGASPRRLRLAARSTMQVHDSVPTRLSTACTDSHSDATLCSACLPWSPFLLVNAVTKKDTQELMALKRMEKFAVLQSNAHLNMVWVERRIMSVFFPSPITPCSCRRTRG